MIPARSIIPVAPIQFPSFQRRRTVRALLFPIESRLIQIDMIQWTSLSQKMPKISPNIQYIYHHCPNIKHIPCFVWSQNTWFHPLQSHGFYMFLWSSVMLGARGFFLHTVCESSMAIENDSPLNEGYSENQL